MGELTGCQHARMAGGEWAELSLAEQMGNIGSEVSRSLRAQKVGNQKRLEGAFARALELFDLTMESWRSNPGRLREVCRAREEFCDYFLGENYATSAARMMKYYDEFAMLARESKKSC